MKKTTSGFTIVELLIVIVVIGILAAITIVAYNGIQQRSRNTQTIAGAKQYIKAVHMYATEKGVYPTVTSCLGDGYEFQGTAGRCGGEANINSQSLFNTQIGEFLSSMPRLSTKNLTIATTNGTRAGGYYAANDGGVGIPKIYYILEGRNESCAAGGDKTANSSAPDMYCTYTFPAP